jgi:hypothetical protein
MSNIAVEFAAIAVVVNNAEPLRLKVKVWDEPDVLVTMMFETTAVVDDGTV